MTARPAGGAGDEVGSQDRPLGDRSTPASPSPAFPTRPSATCSLPLALGWIIERYRVTTDKASGIVNDPNDWCDEHDDPTYIVDLIKKVTTVSVETMKIVDGLAGG